jgi:hypothetical protein
MLVVVNFQMISDLNSVFEIFITNLNRKKKKNQIILNDAKQPFGRGCTFPLRNELMRNIFLIFVLLFITFPV